MTNIRFRDLALAYMAIGLAMGLGAGYLASKIGYETGVLILSIGCVFMAGVAFYISWRRG